MIIAAVDQHSARAGLAHFPKGDFLLALHALSKRGPKAQANHPIACARSGSEPPPIGAPYGWVHPDEER
jgi:hypothetical protein